MTIPSVEQQHSVSPGAPKLHPAVLGRYCGTDGELRELRCLHLFDGRRLLVDWCRARRADPRLVGELAGDEPPENAAILASLYLDDPQKGTCVALCARDLNSERPSPQSNVRYSADALRDEQGVTYRLRTVGDGEHCPELRWTRSGDGGGYVPLSLREVIGRVLAYEPAIALTRRALDPHRREDGVSISGLRAELQRMEASPLLLNSRLRAVVLGTVARGDLSLSEIAMRCGRSKVVRGAVSGETSWLMRRIGLRAESGREAPTPWVHANVLASIAREGLGVYPLEVEVS